VEVVKLVDEIYEFYKHKLTGDEEDIDMLAFAFLEEMTYEDLLSIVKDLNKQELYDLVGVYLIEGLKGKFAQEEFDQRNIPNFQHRNLH
jgi:hypothetical protein